MAVWWFQHLSTSFNTLQPRFNVFKVSVVPSAETKACGNANTPKETQREETVQCAMNQTCSNYSHQDWCSLSYFTLWLLPNCLLSRHVQTQSSGYLFLRRSPAFKPRSVNKLPPKWMCFTPGTTIREGTAKGKHYSALNTSILNASFAPTKPVGTSAAFLRSKILCP